MRLDFRLDGGRQLLDALSDLPNSVERATLMRTLRQEIKPLAHDVQAASPYLWGDLEESLIIGTKLTRRQRSMDREIFSKYSARLHFGTADPAGMMTEFGLGDNAPQPFFRGEWEGHKHSILLGIQKTLGMEIMKSVARHERKLARRR